MLSSCFARSLQSLLLLATIYGAQTASPAPLARAAGPSSELIEPYQTRFGRARPVVAVIGENSGSEFTDFVIPFSLLKQSDNADVFAVSVADGPIVMRPTSLRLKADANVAEFDARFPQGADFVIVPAVAENGSPQLLGWIREQHTKGATLVSICDGALVLANAGVLKGRRATAHWYTAELRQKNYPDTTWVKNTRYVVDGNVISSAGISAAIPTSLALVEAIAGHKTAQALGAKYGVKKWDAAHDSERFVPAFGVNLMPYATVYYFNDWLHANESIGVPLVRDMDDIVLALTMDAYSRTGRSKAFGFASDAGAVRTRNGLTFLPDLGKDDLGKVDRMLPASVEPSEAGVFEKVLSDIAGLYGNNTADGVAGSFEFPRK